MHIRRVASQFIDQNVHLARLILSSQFGTLVLVNSASTAPFISVLQDTFMLEQHSVYDESTFNQQRARPHGLGDAPQDAKQATAAASLELESLELCSPELNRTRRF